MVGHATISYNNLVPNQLSTFRFDRDALPVPRFAKRSAHIAVSYSVITSYINYLCFHTI